MKKTRFQRLAEKHPQKAARIRKDMKSNLYARLEKMTKEKLIKWAEKRKIVIDPDDKKEKIIETILAEVLPNAKEAEPEPVEPEPEPDPDMSWTKAALMAYCDEHDIEYQPSWTKQEILDAIKAA